MPANQRPIFVLTPNCPVINIPGVVASANTARDGSGTLGTNIFNLFTAGSNGSRVDSIKFTSAQATQAQTIPPVAWVQSVLMVSIRSKTYLI